MPEHGASPYPHLYNRLIAITRPEPFATVLASHLHSLGAKTLVAPLTQLSLLAPDPEDVRVLHGWLIGAQKYLNQAQNPYWIILTSPNAVRFTQQWFESAKLDWSLLKACQVAVQGPGTKRLAQQAGLNVVVEANPHSSEGMAQTLLRYIRQSGSPHPPYFQWFRSALAPAKLIELIDQGLNKQTGISHRAVYDTVPAPASPATDGLIEVLGNHQLDTLLFMSPSAVHALTKLWPSSAPDLAQTLSHAKLVVASVGPSTSDALLNIGVKAFLQAPVHSLDGILGTLDTYYSQLEPVK
ncbi:MAG: uroporphyrinogen-III synthase [Cyanobacteria bacterium HKST-UBA04]|nr:uroporphyrinogen-III synthase [Cyanobacteria bacterium HKST-UBA05]MCA9798057.1 uroporphyrinogen-III synthase [Cyanobacteria bacterium HKST-UBA04]